MPDMKEINEARRAGNEVLRLLDEVERNLKSARNWGFYDMIGGGFFSSLIKHDKVGRAEKLMQDVKRALFNLQRELKDVNLSIPDTVVVSDLEKFLDIAFDNIVSDWFTQSRINQSLREVERIRAQVQKILWELNQLR
ncbi:MAG: hypothetical protein ACOX29_11010 [Bacillota bacterium]|jgi:hypothetical protein|nr:hypothetical protein [Bacillota bacterium]NLU54102.1 hypothetical protein [Bacillota bacterium]HOA91806.1 hypothetical protein [Bacillota bacterium]HOP53340.1 hypothetical protein [Bacillota bacterium]HPT60866.1 hypothetical protein [Bacillota bacterium]